MTEENHGFKVGQNVYDRHADIFGTIESIEGGKAMIKYNWPMSENAPASEVPLTNLMTPTAAARLGG